MKSMCLVLACLLTIGSGCALEQGQYAPVSDPQGTAIPAGRCRIYVYTEMSPWKGGVSVEVCDNVRVIGNLSPKTYLCWEREAGKADLSTYTGSKDSKHLIALDAKAGETYYVCLGVNLMSTTPGNAITARLVDIQEAKESFVRCGKPPMITGYN